MSCRPSKNDDGDLGLGRGLKPGGLERDDEDVFLTHTGWFSKQYKSCFSICFFLYHM